VDPEARSREIVFIIGAGRSGTTWLHLMMGSHAAIATGQESQVFNEYLAPLYRRWEAELAWPATEQVRKHGISSYLTEAEFVGLLRRFALDVLGKVFSDKPGATHILEKSPNNSFHIDLIRRCFPEARFIHVIRDGRDVATSMLMAGEGWGRSWAPTRVEDAALEWRAAVRGALRAKDAGRNYTEVRYEDLLANGEAELVRLFDFVGIQVSPEEARETYARFSFDKLKAGDYSRSVFANPGLSPASGTRERKEPPGFFRKGVSGDWQNLFRGADLRAFLWVAGDLLHDLGYLEPGVRIPPGPPLSLRARSWLRSARASLASVGKKVLGA
jgi:hypothetical protein